MNKLKNPISLIQTFLDKEETHEHLARIHNLVLSLYQKQNPKGAVKAGHAGAVTRWGTAWTGEHLRPMYRTVHRQIPRPMVLRAIRWVNPKRMFPIMNLKKEDMEKMSKEEFEKAFVELAEYRREAHVINNRYNQMLRMIDAGQLPYFIPYANIPGQRYKDLAQYRERAQRLGLGAADWGHEIDQQAEMFRKAYESGDGKIKGQLDDIDGLWEDGKGEPSPPPFMRVHRRFKEDRLMRKKRRWHDRFKFTNSDGDEIITVGEDTEQAANKAFEIVKAGVPAGVKYTREEFDQRFGKPKKLKRVMVASAQIWARQFIAVPKAEIREGEDVRMPAERDVEGAAAFLLRVPDPAQSWMDDKQWADLKRGKGPLTIGPAEAKVKIHWSEVGDDEIDTRVEERWTQEGRAGGRKARHRGARSDRPGGHGTEPPIQPIRLRVPQAPAPRPAAPRPGAAKPDTAEREKAQQAVGKRQAAQKKVNDDIAQKLVDLKIVGTKDDLWIDVKGAPKRWEDESYLVPENVKKVGALSGGFYNKGASFWVEMKDGRKLVYKVAAGEQLGELLHLALDRGLGINVSPMVKIHNFGVAMLDDAKARGELAGIKEFDRSRVVDFGEKGGGHVEEWAEEWTTHPPHGASLGKEYFDTPEKRATVWGVLLLDMLTGNRDRHHGNIMVSKDSGVLPIDSGFAGHVERKKATDAKVKVNTITDTGLMRFGTDMQPLIDDGSITVKVLEEEIRQYYKDHMDSAVIDKIIDAFGGIAKGNTKNNEKPETVENFVTAAMRQIRITP